MRKYLLLIVVLTWITVTATPALASSPSIAGEIAGIEICPQFVCEAAVFNGTCDCEIDKWQTIGFCWVSIGVPLLGDIGRKVEPDDTQGEVLSGRVVGGSITNNGNSTFNVTATLRLRKGGMGNVVVSGVLDHTEIPPSFAGELFQSD